MDPEFNFLKKLIIGADLNTTAARDHVPEIKIQTQLLKDWMRAVYGGLPYDCMNSRMIIELGKYAVMMINAFPPKSGISHTYSPRTIMTGKQTYFNKQ